MRKIFALPLRLVTLMFAFCLMATPLAAQQITETFSHNANSFQMQFVKIGDAGNSGKNVGLSRPIGDVNYEYWMGKFEVDAWQIAVGNASGIVGVSVADWNHRGYTFGTNPPATGISWQEAARFVNWMNISKGYSPAYKFASYGPFNSYDPTYTGLNDMMMLWDPNDVGYNPNNPFRNSRARYFLPSLDEWFKAAFYDPTLNSGSGGYWYFPSTSDTPPTPISGGAAGAVYSSQAGPANVDNAGSLSWYGTMAQGGNVWELAETAFDLNNNDINKNRAVVGGDWQSPATQISSDFMVSQTPSAPNDSYGIGFRVAMVVEPPDSDLDQDGVTYYREERDGTDPNDPNSFNPLSKGLVAYYPFDGNANDESGYGNNGDEYGVAYSSDRLGTPSTAADFRNNAYIEVPGLRSINNYPITYSVWMYLESYHTSLSWRGWGEMLLVGKDEPGVGNGAVISIHTDDDVANTLGYTGFLTSYAPPLAKWSLVTLSIDTNRQATFYIDGLPIASWSATTQYNFEFTDLPFRISTPYIFDQFARQSFQGYLDSIRIYDRALSATEVAQLYINDMACITDPNSGLTVAAEFLTSFGFQRYSSGVADVTDDPGSAGLFTQDQFEDNRSAGRSDVVANPMDYGLYNSSSIMDLRMGGLMIQKQGTDATIIFQPQTTTDLETLPFTNNGTPITNAIPMPGDKGFLRVEAIYVPAGDLPSGY